MTGAEFVKIVQSRGSDAKDPRDAAHEAAHALQYGLRKRWTRDNVHEGVLAYVDRKVTDMRRFIRREAMLVTVELEARAIESLACERFGIEYDREHWALMAWMETSKAFRIDMGSIKDIIGHVRGFSERHQTIALFERVMALKPSRRKTVEVQP